MAQLQRFWAVTTVAWAAIAVSATVVVAEGQQRSVRDGVYTQRQAERGQAIYAAQCEACHKPDLRGEQMTPSLVGVSFAFRWNGRSLADYFTGLRSTMPQSAPGGLSDATYVDLVAFILAENDYPAGTAELVPEPDALSRIRIQADF